MWPIFVINLRAQPQRMAESRHRLAAAGLAYSRFEAVDWRDLTAEDLTRSVRPRRPRFAKASVTPPEIACFLSHVGLWRRIAEGDAPAAFVFEDDFELDAGLPALLSAIAERPVRWDMLKLYTNKRKRLADAERLPDGFVLGAPRILPMSTLAYAITRPAAAALARDSLPIGRPIDLYLKHWWEHGACVKLVQPSPVARRARHQDSSALEAARREGKPRNPILRFGRNLAYQLAFQFGTLWRRGERPRDRRWAGD